jgi:DNA transposition AAA+ family ATPase
MKEKFVVTKNVRKFHAAIQKVNHKLHGVERMAVVKGEVGLGKTETALQYAAQNGTVLLTVWPRMTQHWLLRELARELHLDPAWRTEALIDQIKKALRDTPRTIIFDEVDHFFVDRDSKRIDALETLRKIHDVCRCPMIFVGEENIDKKIGRMRRIDDRIVETVNFEKLTEPDVRQFISELTDCKFGDDAIERITRESNGRIRPIMNMIHAAEGAARIHQLKSITAKDF